MKIPTIQEIAEYIAEKGYQIDAEEFWLYYDSVGWKVGKSLKPMKSWKSSIGLWSKSCKKAEPKYGKQLSIEERGKRVGLSAGMGETWEAFAVRIEQAERRMRH